MEAFDASLRAMGEGIGASKFRRFLINRSSKKVYATVHAFVDKQIRTALKSETSLNQTEKKSEDSMQEKSKYIILNHMVKKSQDVYALRHQVMNIFFPARDTSGIAMTNVIFDLARHPHVWEKLRTEVQDIGDQKLTFEFIKNLKWPKMILNESLRLHLPATMAVKAALTDTILPVGGGPDQLSPLFVPKGKRIGIQMYAVHRNREIWGDDVDEFKPERWAEGRPLWEAKWQYLPFMGGIRMCPAQQMVLAQLTYMLVRFAQEFSVLENRDEVMEWMGEVKMTVESRNGAKVALTPA